MLNEKDKVRWSAQGRSLVTHHHEHHDSSGRPLAHDRRDGTLKHHHEEKLVVVRGLENGTVRVQHPDGSESERHPDLLELDR